VDLPDQVRYLIDYRQAETAEEQTQAMAQQLQ
jgi:hypothetical protein